jgi:hypothetical protein
MPLNRLLMNVCKAVRDLRSRRDSRLPTVFSYYSLPCNDAREASKCSHGGLQCPCLVQQLTLDARRRQWCDYLLDDGFMPFVTFVNGVCDVTHTCNPPGGLHQKQEGPLSMTGQGSTPVFFLASWVADSWCLERWGNLCMLQRCDHPACVTMH